MTNNIHIVFAGLARDCEEELVANISFLQELIKFNLNKLDISVFILENDSVDNTKDIIKTLENEECFKIFTLHGLDLIIDNRIERITYCRNYLLKQISLEFNTSNSELILIPLDLDIDLFSLTTIEFFDQLLRSFLIDTEMDAVFPNSIPYYYDIHALRAKNWNNIDSWSRVDKISKFIPVGKFFIRYLLIYKKQFKIPLSNENIKISSAFGGMGLYKLTSNKLKRTLYQTDKLGKICEHVEFNKNFKNLFILPNWAIEAPKLHLEFKLKTFTERIIYIFLSLSSDLKNFFSYIIKMQKYK
jgi:hypothetical protein